MITSNQWLVRTNIENDFNAIQNDLVYYDPTDYKFKPITNLTQRIEGIVMEIYNGPYWDPQMTIICGNWVFEKHSWGRGIGWPGAYMYQDDTNPSKITTTVATWRSIGRIGLFNNSVAQGWDTWAIRCFDTCGGKCWGSGGWATTPIMWVAPTVSSVTSSGANLSGTFVTDNGSPVTATGFVVYPSGTDPYTIWSPNVINVIGTPATSSPFTASASGLTAGTNYCVRSYATNANGTSYSSEICFTTMTGAGQAWHAIFQQNWVQAKFIDLNTLSLVNSASTITSSTWWFLEDSDSPGTIVQINGTTWYKINPYDLSTLSTHYTSVNTYPYTWKPSARLSDYFYNTTNWWTTEKRDQNTPATLVATLSQFGRMLWDDGTYVYVTGNSWAVIRINKATWTVAWSVTAWISNDMNADWEIEWGFLYVHRTYSASSSELVRIDLSTFTVTHSTTTDSGLAFLKIWWGFLFTNGWFSNWVITKRSLADLSPISSYNSSFFAPRIQYRWWSIYLTASQGIWTSPIHKVDVSTMTVTATSSIANFTWWTFYIPSYA